MWAWEAWNRRLVGQHKNVFYNMRDNQQTRQLVRTVAEGPSACYWLILAIYHHETTAPNDDKYSMHPPLPPTSREEAKAIRRPLLLVLTFNEQDMSNTATTKSCPILEGLVAVSKNKMHI